MFKNIFIAAAIPAVLRLSPSMAAAADAPGLKPGDKAPAFTLKDQNGKERSLEELLKNGPVAMVFYRSADW